MAREHYGNDYTNANPPSDYDRVAERKRKYRRRRIIRRRIIASVIMVLIVAFILFIASLFVRVKEISITGTFGKYTYEDVMEASGLKEGDKLLYISAETVEDKIEKSLPYMVNVKVKKRLFSKVFIEVDYCSEAYCLYTSGEYVVVNFDFKVLRIEENYEQNSLLKMVGLETEKATVGEVLSFTDETKLDYFNKLRDGLKGEPFGELSVIDVTDTLNLKVSFDNGFEIKFGNYTNLDYNLGWAKSVVSELQNKHDEVNGSLDLSIFKKAYYTPRSGEEEPTGDIQ